MKALCWKLPSGGHAAIVDFAGIVTETESFLVLAPAGPTQGHASFSSVTFDALRGLSSACIDG
jgi:hypothetical protein